MYHRPPKLQADYALQVIRAMFRSENWQIGLLVLFLLLLLNWLARSIYEISIGEFYSIQWITILLFIFLVSGLFLSARKAPGRVNVVVDQDENPQKCKALVLFLSPPGRDETWLEIDSNLREIAGRIGDRSVRERLKFSWRMPLEAIAYHLERVEKVVILPSSDSPPKPDDPNPTDGTFRKMELFKKLVFFAAGRREEVQFLGLGDLDSRWNKGVDFENAEALVDALEQVFDWLHDEKVKDHEIMVDITGGQKVPTVAGAAVALSEGRRFQYVSTRDYKVRSYDITYRVSS